MTDRRQRSSLTNGVVARISAALPLLWCGPGLFYLLDSVDDIETIATRNALPIKAHRTARVGRPLVADLDWLAGGREAGKVIPDESPSPGFPEPTPKRVRRLHRALH